MRWRVVASLVLLSLISVTAASAQIGQTATLIGTVKDASGGVLPGVNVSITSPALIGGARTVVTAADGTFRFSGIAPGVYEVTFTLQGFKPVKRENVNVQLGETVSLPAVLEVGGLQETVTVSSESPIVDVKIVGAAEEPHARGARLHSRLKPVRPGRHDGRARRQPHQLYGVRERRQLVELLPDGRRRRLRSEERHPLGVRKLQLDPGSPGDQPWRQCGVRRVHRCRVEQPVQVGQQPVSRPVRDALPDRLDGVGQHDTGDPGTEPEPQGRDDGLRHRHDGPDRRTVEARQGLVLHELSVPTARRRRLRDTRPPTPRRGRPGRRRWGGQTPVSRVRPASFSSRPGRSARTTSSPGSSRWSASTWTAAVRAPSRRRKPR